jgi:hypothetical protein
VRWLPPPIQRSAKAPGRSLDRRGVDQGPRPSRRPLRDLLPPRPRRPRSRRPPRQAGRKPTTRPSPAVSRARPPGRRLVSESCRPSGAGPMSKPVGSRRRRGRGAPGAAVRARRRRHRHAPGLRRSEVPGSADRDHAATLGDRLWRRPRPGGREPRARERAALELARAGRLRFRLAGRLRRLPHPQRAGAARPCGRWPDGGGHPGPELSRGDGAWRHRGPEDGPQVRNSKRHCSPETAPGSARTRGSPPAAWTPPRSSPLSPRQRPPRSSRWWTTPSSTRPRRQQPPARTLREPGVTGDTFGTSERMVGFRGGGRRARRARGHSTALRPRTSTFRNPNLVHCRRLLGDPPGTRAHPQVAYPAGFPVSGGAREAP